MDFFTASDGARIAYRDEGAGLPVLALAGLTRNSDDFNFVAPHLDGVRLIRMDYRGRGESDFTGAPTYTTQQEGADALALLDHLGVEAAALLGTSRGGLIGMGLAALAPERLLGLCLNDVGPVLDTSGLDVILSYLGLPPKEKSFAEAAQNRQQWFGARGFENVPLERWEAEARCLFKEGERRLTLRYDPALRDAVLAATQFEMPDLWPFFDAASAKPMAVIHGQNSDLLSAETVAEMQRRNPALIVGSVPGRAHVPFLDEPEALAAIRAWLTAIRGAA
ncbi:MAG: alpha/beta hydrolase [Rhodobacterales bacterium]|nr:MAG: alpha/beta hydrolase [Rhodobacterales bacterium]